MATRRRKPGKARTKRAQPAPRQASPRRSPVRKKAPVRRTKAIKVTARGGPDTDDGKVRLNRFLAAAGVCSRRAADSLIESGRVRVNGRVKSELGVRVDPDQDEVLLDDVRVQKEKPVYVLFNKPKDVVCTNAGNEVRRRVIDFMSMVRGRIYTVGRLDAESEGLILLTNDGDFAQAVAHPRHGVPKTYAVLVRGEVNESDMVKARGGVWLAEGKTGGSQIKIGRRSRDKTYMTVTIREGKNREIRRVFARLGHNVLTLKRVRIGSLTLHGLRPGKHRFLRPAEVQEILATAKGGS